jgi:hypothetical protein
LTASSRHGQGSDNDSNEKVRKHIREDLGQAALETVEPAQARRTALSQPRRQHADGVKKSARTVSGKQASGRKAPVRTASKAAARDNDPRGGLIAARAGDS